MAVLPADRAAIHRRARHVMILLAAGTALAACRTGAPAGTARQAGAPRPAARLSDDVLERQVIEELNRARTNPARYADYLESTLMYYDGLKFRRPTDTSILLTREGASAVREAIRVLRATKPLPPLALSTGMTRAAHDHVRDQGPRGTLEHEGSDGSMAWDRVDRYGKWSGRVSENMSFGPETGRDVVAALIVDDGVKSRGHRKNLLEPDIRIVGVACGTHKTYRRMCDVVHASKYSERTTAAKH